MFLKGIYKMDMIKFSTPSDIILREATLNNNVSVFLDRLSSLLSEQVSFPPNGFRYDIESTEILQPRDISLIQFVIEKHGWNSSINLIASDGNGCTYRVFLIESKKIYL